MEPKHLMQLAEILDKGSITAAAETLRRLGLRAVAQVLAQPRAGLARRIGLEAVRRIDQALGLAAEPLSPLPEKPPLAARIGFPEPIGRVEDVTAALARLLAQLCARLADEGLGASGWRLICGYCEGGETAAQIGLARPSRDPEAALRLFARPLSQMEAGFGFDRLRLEVLGPERIKPAQIGAALRQSAALEDALARIGNRIGFDRLARFADGDSHMPERAFREASALHPARPVLAALTPRPIALFAPEPVEALDGAHPPRRLRWRRMALETLTAEGPERIAPDWLHDDPLWRSGLRDYWRVETQGPGGAVRRLWLFHTPEAPAPAWFAQGVFG